MKIRPTQPWQVLLDNGNGQDSDPDGDPLNVVSVGLPDQGGTATINDNGTPGDPTDDVLIDYAPAASFVGIETFTYTITDGALIDTAMVAVTVVNANEAAPDALDDTFTVLEDSVDNPLDVLTNDTDADPGDTLTITFVDTSGAVGTALINDKGTPSDPTDDVIDYTPQIGFSGTDSFSYTIQDVGGLSDTATVTVTVDLVGGDLAVDFNNYTIQSYGGQVISVPTAFAVEDGGMTLHLMGNTWKAIQLTPAYTVTADTVVEFDFMNDGTYLAEINAIGLDTQPVALNAAITFAIYGTQNWGNRDFFGYGGSGWQHYVIPVGAYYSAGDRAYLFLTNDADHGQNTSVRFRNVQIHEGAGGGNAAPVAQDDTFTVNEDTANTTLAVLLDNGNGPDSDLDGDPLNIVSVGLPDQGGTATINDNGTPGDPTDDVLIDYAPAANFVGIETFTYTITDGVLSDTAMVTVTVVNANDAAPVALDDTFTVLEDSVDNPLDVLANDTDADPGDTLTITFVDTSGAVGTALINDKGTPSDPTDDVIDYTPQIGFSGTDSFSYTIQDMGGLSDTATVTVTVNLGLAVDFDN